MSNQPIIVGEPPRQRAFACSAVALQAYVINEKREVVLLSSPTRNRPNEWQVVSGAMEAGESLLEGAWREAKEELGDGVQLRPLGVFHAATFHFDGLIRYVVSIHYLFAYEGGPIVPGDDMVGSEARWWTPQALVEAEASFSPSTNLQLIRRAIQVYELWKNEEVLLQRPLA